MNLSDTETMLVLRAFRSAYIHIYQYAHPELDRVSSPAELLATVKELRAAAAILGDMPPVPIRRLTHAEFNEQIARGEIPATEYVEITFPDDEDEK